MLFDDPNVVLDELQGLHCLDEVLLVQILLRVLAVGWACVGLRHFCYELIEGVALVGRLWALLRRVGAVRLAVVGRSAWLDFVAMVSTTHEVGITSDGRVLTHRQRVPLRCPEPVHVRISTALQATVLQSRWAIRDIHRVLVLLVLLLHGSGRSLATCGEPSACSHIIAHVTRIFILKRVVEIVIFCSLCDSNSIRFKIYNLVLAWLLLDMLVHEGTRTLRGPRV